MSSTRSDRSLLGVAARCATVAIAIAGLSGAAAACGTAAVEGGAVCVFGQESPCATDAGCQGTQVCLPDLSGYGPCSCGADAGGSSPDASAPAAPDGGR